MIKFKTPEPFMMDYIKRHFIYNHITGELFRDDRKNSCGSLDKDGYLILKIKGKQYKAHRIAWFLYYGQYPQKEIDHINRVRSDNRICNLRLASRSENVRNSSFKINKDTGVVGVRIDKTKGLKKRFATTINNKTYRFNTLEDAIEFRNKYYYV